MPTKLNIDWLDVDWRLSTNELANELTCSYSTIIHKRRKYAPETILKPKQIDWENVDWLKSNNVLAAELGCYHSTIYKKRCIYAPKTIKNH